MLVDREASLVVALTTLAQVSITYSSYREASMDNGDVPILGPKNPKGACLSKSVGRGHRTKLGDKRGGQLKKRGEGGGDDTCATQ